MCVISIIIPIYNTSSVLTRCLDSVQSQTYTDWECLLIDDGSTDGSGAICDEYPKKDSRFRVFHQQNRGVSAARNVGLDNARGEWITFIDSDDWVEKDLLKDYADNFDGVDFVKQGVIWHAFDGVGGRERICVIPQNRDDSDACLKELYMNGMLGYIWTSAIRRDIVEAKKLRFDEELHWSEDWIFILKYLHGIGKIRIVGKCNYIYHPPIKLVHRIRKEPYLRIRASSEKLLLARRIFGDNVLDYTGILFEVIMLYKWPGTKRRERISVLIHDVYIHEVEYHGKSIRLQILCKCIRFLTPTFTDIIMRILSTF